MENRATYTLLLLSLFWAGIPQAQEKTSVPPTGGNDLPSAIETITSPELRDHVFYLASDFLEGRLPGSEGFNQAALYVTSQLRAAGFTPKTDSSNGRYYYSQPIDFVISTIAPHSVLQVKQGRKEIQWKFGEQFLALLHNQSFGNGRLEGSAVFVGYGIEEAAYGWDDYENVDVAGKIAIVYIGTPMKDDKPVLPEEKNEFYGGMMQSIMTRMMSAFSRGASGILMIPDAQTLQMWPMLASRLNQPARRLKGDVSNAACRQLPVFLLHPEAAAELFGEADFDPVSGKGNVGSTHLEGVNLTFNLEYVIDREFVCRNTIGFVPGSDPGLKNEYIVVSAHLDHLGTSGEEAFNGANDNASGCAAMLEALEAMVMTPQRRPVFFVFTTGEERAGHGSYYFINNLPFPLERIRLAINIDMVGRNSPQHPDAVLGVTPDDMKLELAGFVERANESIAKVNLETSLSGVDFGDYFGSGDEAMFALRGIPAVLVTTGFGWPDYHQTTDDPDLLDYERVADAARLAYAMITAAANDDVPF